MEQEWTGSPAVVRKLHEELAGATRLVWQMQNALSEQPGPLPVAMATLSSELVCQAIRIAGLVLESRRPASEARP